MRFVLLFFMLGLLLPFGADAQGRVAASNRTSKFTSGRPVTVKKKTRSKDKPMGLGAPRVPSSFANNDIAEGYNTLEAQNWDAAIDQLDDYSDEDPDAAYALGYAHYQNGDVEEAIGVLERSSDDPDVLYELGLIYSEQGDYQKAEEKFLELLIIDPEDADAWYELGFIYLETGYFEDAALFFEEVLYIDPSDPDAPYEMARAYAAMGDTESALESLESAFENGFEDLALVMEDPDLEFVRADERFGQLIDAYFHD